MTKFNDEEFALFDFIVDKILSKKKNSLKGGLETRQQEPTANGNYVGETFYQKIDYGGEPFLLLFKKHLIDSNPKEKYDKNFMVRVNNFFDKDVFRTSFEAHPQNWRRNFQDQVNRVTTGNWNGDDIDKWNKEPFVAGISVQVWESGAPINIFNPSDDPIYDEEDTSIFIQTNNINEAKQNTEKYFLKIILDGLDYFWKLNNNITKKNLLKKKKKSKTISKKL
jgi:hypothetical protein